MPAIRRLVLHLLKQAPELEPLTRWSELVLVLTDDDGIAPLNSAFLGKSAPTDVISFIYNRLPGEPGSGAGEVVVNVERAWQLGRTPQPSSHELALYVAHGLHHLTGASDHTPRRRARMRRRELAWLKKATASGHLQGLFATRTRRPAR
jgi:rRNA maturation RNase YbeY